MKKRDADGVGRALRRIVTLLFALAAVADRAGTMPFPARLILLAVLRHAERVAWTFAAAGSSACPPLDGGGVASGDGRGAAAMWDCTPGAPDRSLDGPAEAARLAFSLRTLALIVARWAIRALTSPPERSSLRPARAPGGVGRAGNWRGPAALAAPDTS